MRSPWSYVSNNWPLKVTAVAIAFALWLGVQGSRPYLYRMSHVPVRIANHDTEWVIASPPSPAEVTIEFRAPFRDLLHLSATKPVVVIPVDAVKDTASIVELRQAWVDLGAGNTGVMVRNIDPDSVRVSFDRVATRLVTLHARFSGTVADGYEIVGTPIVEPAVVRASGAARRLARLDSLELPNIDITGMHGTDTVRVNIDTTGVGARITPIHAVVYVPIRRKLAPTPSGIR